METLDTRLRKRIQVSLYALLFLVGLLGLSVLLESCTDACETYNEYTYYKPVYTTLQDIRSSVDLLAPKEIEASGKIYIKDKWLFVNEPGKGIHIIDNTDPSGPVNKHFLNIPGNYDLAVKGNILYADSYVDLVALNISDIDHIAEVNRLENIFLNYNTLGFYLDPGNGLITEWVEQTDVKVYESDCEAEIQPWGGIYFEGGVAFSNKTAFDASTAIAPGNGSGPGVGGSMARFTINEDHLYMLDGGEIQSINISDGSQPVVASRNYLAWDIETIFPYDNHLFIGSRSGMHILSLSDPASPSKISTYDHIRGVCDPVVVQDDYAYVTLRSGTQCDGFTNQLEVINIEELTNPFIVKTYPMTNPHGLGIDDNTLFICDGDAGLKVYDASDINTIDKNQLAHYTSINAYDVIPFNDLLIMIGSDGIFQYDYSDPRNIKFLSRITVSNESD